MNKFIKGIIDSFIELIYPKRCVCCDGILSKIEKEVGICKACSKSIKIVGRNYCMKCGAPLLKREDEYCATCRDNSHIYNQAKAVFQYTGEMKNAMYRFKYSNRRCYGKVFARHILKVHGDWIKAQQFEAIIPVPMHDRKKKKRGYNQAEVLAKELSTLTNIPVNDRIVRREMETQAMKQLNRQKRKKNLLNAFILAENDVQFRKVLIIDDIYTTGSTLDEVAKVLKTGGITEVYGVCVCIGQAQ